MFRKMLPLRNAKPTIMLTILFWVKLLLETRHPFIVKTMLGKVKRTIILPEMLLLKKTIDTQKGICQQENIIGACKLY